MHLSPDVGSRAPLGLAWGLSATEQVGESFVTLLLTYSGEEQYICGCRRTSSSIYNFFIVEILSQLVNVLSNSTPDVDNFIYLKSNMRLINLWYVH